MPTNMIRVQSYFPQELLMELKYLAEEQSISVAELLRQAAKHLVARVKRPKKTPTDNLYQCLKKIRFEAEPDLSQKIDEIVYADPR